MASGRVSNMVWWARGAGGRPADRAATSFGGVRGVGDAVRGDFAMVLLLSLQSFQPNGRPSGLTSMITISEPSWNKIRRAGFSRSVRGDGHSQTRPPGD